MTVVADRGHRVAAILHDPMLQDEKAFTETAAAYALMTLDNHRLSTQAVSLVREVRESRARIQSSADDERRRIEHDLHDGAQQRLVALRIKLELAAERAGDNGGSAELLRGLGSEVEEALDEVRSLARGIYPAQLADRGLVEALRSVGAAVGPAHDRARRRHRPLPEATSRAPRTSAASKRCRTRTSTPATPRRWWWISPTTASSASRSATTVWGSTR